LILKPVSRPWGEYERVLYVSFIQEHLEPFSHSPNTIVSLPVQVLDYGFLDCPNIQVQIMSSK